MPSALKKMPIESGMLTRSLEGAQKKVETYYYDIRKQVFEYDGDEQRVGRSMLSVAESWKVKT